MYPCKKCRGPIADGETVCPVCGWDQAKDLPEEKKVPAAVGEQPAPNGSAGKRRAPAYHPTIRACPVCGGPLGADDGACAVCGLQDPMNAGADVIAEYRRRREEEAAEAAARASEAARRKAQKEAEEEQKKAALREKITAKEKEQADLGKMIKIFKAALTVAVIVLIIGGIGCMANGQTSRKEILSGDDLPEWTADSALGDVVRITVADVEDWFTLTTTTTTSTENRYLPGYTTSSSTKSYKGFAGLTTDDGRKIYIYYYISDGDANLSTLANKYDNVTLLELGEYTFPMVSEPFSLAGKLVTASSVISTKGFDSSSMQKYNEIKDIPFMDISVTSKTIDVPIEGAQARKSLFTTIAIVGLILALAMAAIRRLLGKKMQAADLSVLSLRRQMDQI